MNTKALVGSTKQWNIHTHRHRKIVYCVLYTCKWWASAEAVQNDKFNETWHVNNFSFYDARAHARTQNTNERTKKRVSNIISLKCNLFRSVHLVRSCARAFIASLSRTILPWLFVPITRINRFIWFVSLFSCFISSMFSNFPQVDQCIQIVYTLSVLPILLYEKDG